MLDNRASVPSPPICPRKNSERLGVRDICEEQEENREGAVGVESLEALSTIRWLSSGVHVKSAV
jgi:hypothetical protein